MAEQESWLPNLVGGVSIWKLAVDLNDPKFMDGRLLEPETEGSDSLPARVSWDLTGLVPLNEARRDHAAALEQAIAGFFACLEKVREQLEDEDSGYHQYQEAFTVPGLDVDDGGHYFFGPDDGKLYVINWGASPRSIKHEQAFLFGYDSFRDLYDQEGIEPAAAASAAAAAATSATAAAADAADGQADVPQAAAEAADEKKDEKKDDDKDDEEDGEGRPWWVWLLVALGAIALVVLLLLLLQQCDEQKPDQPGADGGSASSDAGGAGQGGKGGNDTAAAIADGGAAGHGGAGGGGGANTGGAGGASAGGASAGGAGGAGDGSGAAAPVTPAPGVEPGSGGACGGTVKVITGGGSGPPKPVTPAPGQSHRAHFHPKAIAWRVEQGYQHVDRVETDKSTYHVFLKPGATFEKVRVQWQDRNGQWHDH